MTTHALPATEHELGILTADKPLLAILRPMDGQPPEDCVRIELDPDWGWVGLAEDESYIDPPEYPGAYGYSVSPPYAPGDVIVWQEEWCLDYSSPHTNEVGIHFPPNVHRHFKVSHETAVTVLCTSGKGFQPATTMPESIARFRNTVAECRPVKVCDLTAAECGLLGYLTQSEKQYEFAGSLHNFGGRSVMELFEYDWQSNNPDHPFASSWAWWIELKGKYDG